MSKFVMEIECDNDAFHDHQGKFSPEPEIVYILMDFAKGVGMGKGLTRPVLDSNGNQVGKAKLVITA